MKYYVVWAILDFPFQSIGAQYEYLQNNDHQDDDKLSVNIKCNNNYGGCIVFIKRIKMEYDV